MLIWFNTNFDNFQVRRIADLYFMMKLWKPAYNYYYIAKKDFQSDEAWPYYASAVECAALSMFMLSSAEPGMAIGLISGCPKYFLFE